MRRLYDKTAHTIAHRHIFSFLLLIAIPTLLIVLLSGWLFRREIVRITTGQQYRALEQTADGIDSGIKEFALMASALVHDRSLMEKSLGWVRARRPEDRYLMTLSLDDIFNRYFILTKQLGSFYLVFKDGSGPYVCRNYGGIKFTREEMGLVVAEGNARPDFVQVLDSIAPGQGSSSDRPVVSLVVNPISKPGAQTGVGSLLLSFDFPVLADFIGRKGDTSLPGSQVQSSAFLVGRSGEILASSEAGMSGRRYAEVKRELRGYLIIERPVGTPRWSIVEAINIASLTQKVDSLMRYIYAALVVIIGLFLWYNSLFFAQIVNPLKALSKEMETLAKGNFSARVESCSFTELNRLGDMFNLMVEEIGGLTSEIKAEHRERLKAEIEALRYQLNPHFLCNTLNSIRMMAMISKNDAIQKMTTALMIITEDNLGRDDTVYSLEREMKNIDSYIYIMKVRYGDSFDFYADIDSSLLPLGVPSMILQPLVENAILHGLHGLSRSGSITVAASRTDEVLRLEVRDNGFGMTGEKVEKIFDERTGASRGLNRIGLYNVRRRLFLLYGGAFDVAVSSYPDEGTVVSLSLPILVPSDSRARLSELEVVPL